jgi:hypothetical protein
MPKGRMTIRRRPATQLAGDPMVTVDGRENRRVRLWELDIADSTRQCIGI